MLTALNRSPRPRAARARSARLSLIALVLWLVLQAPVIWLGNPSGALVVLTVVTWGGWALGVSTALLPRARWPLLVLATGGVIALLAFDGFVLLGLLFLPAIAISLALWLSWRVPDSAGN